MGIRSRAVNRAVYLDRDGVLNLPVIRNGLPFPPASVAETRIFDDALPALGMLKDAGYKLAMISNQPDVARGTTRRQEVEAINAMLVAALPIDHLEVCYHDDADQCDCRKPKPGLIYMAARKLGVDPKNGFVIGDRWRDIEAGRAAACRTVWIDRGYSERLPTDYDFRAGSLLASAEWILEQ